MNSDYGNYSKDLAKAREGFNETTRKMRENYDKSLRDTQDTSIRKEEELKRNHSADKNKLIEENQDKLKLISDRTNEVLERKQQEFLDGLRGERESFSTEKKRFKDQMQTSLLDVKDSYTQSLDEHKLQTERLSRDNEFKYLQNLQTNKNNTDKKIVEIQNRTNEMISKNNNDLSDQKREILHKNQKDLEIVNRTGKDALDKKTEYFNRKIDEIVTTKDDENARQKERYEGTIFKMKDDNRQQVDNMISRYEDHSKELLNNFQSNYGQQESDNINEKNQIRSELNKEIYNVKREANLQDDKHNTGGNGTNQKALITDNYERRLDNIRRQMTDQAVKFQRESAEASNQAQVKLKERDLEHRMATDKKEDSFYKEYSGLERRSKENESQISESFINKMQEQENSDLKKINYEKDLGNARLEYQKKEFGKTVNKLADLNVRNVEKLQEENAREKAQILDTAKKQYFDNVRDIKDTFRLKQEKTFESFNKKLDFKENENSIIREQSENTIAKIEEHSKRMIENEVNYNRDSREAFKRSMVEEFQDAKRNYQINTNRMKSEYDLSLQKIKKENDITLSRMNKKFEEQVNSTELEKNKEIKKLNNEFKSQYERLAKDTKIERELLVEHYERRIQELKTMFELEKIKERDAQVKNA